MLAPWSVYILQHISENHPSLSPTHNRPNFNADPDSITLLLNDLNGSDGYLPKSLNIVGGIMFFVYILYVTDVDIHVFYIYIYIL